MSLLSSFTLAQAAPAPTSVSPLLLILFIVVALVALGFIVAAIARSRRKKKLEGEARERAQQKLPQKESLEVKKAERNLELARREREEAELKAKQEQEARGQRESAAKAKADADLRAAEEASKRAAELKEQAKKAATPEERRTAEEAAARAAEEAARLQKDAQREGRRAEYEARKGHEAEQKAERRAQEEQRRLEALAEEKKKAEEDARAAVLKQAKVEAESGRTLRDGLEKTRGGFMARITALVGGAATLDDKFLAELEEILLTADIGVRTSMGMLEVVREKLKRKELANPDKVKAALREEIERIVTLNFTYQTGGMPAPKAKPQVIMIVGVNGSGKTTSIGKLSFKERVNGRNVLLGAGDTFRAAATEQLDIWAKRAEVEIVKGKPDGDPAAVCFDAVKKGVDEQRDLVLLDTAGRLHTQLNLMEELRKVKRVIEKALPGAPHETWLVVDGTMGQNAVFQARQFHEALGLTGLVLTKLDGTAKGGVVIGICDELKVPVRYIGVGEKIGDLRPFSPKEFVEALFAE